MQGGASADVVWQFYLPTFGLPAIALGGLLGLQGGAVAGRTTTLITAAAMFFNAGLISLLATTIEERRDGFYPNWTDRHPRELGLVLVAMAILLVVFAFRSGRSTEIR